MTRAPAVVRVAAALVVLASTSAASSGCLPAGPGASGAGPAATAAEGNLRAAGRAPTGGLSDSAPNPSVVVPADTTTTTTTTTTTAARRPAPPGSVLARFAMGRPARPAAVGARVAALQPTRDLGARLGVLVVDPYTGAVLAGRARRTAVAPASTTKLLTATAALARYGAGHRFSTRVVLEGSAGGIARLVLVGGGDPSLTSIAAGTPAARAAAASATAVSDPARLPGLAALTARALRARGLGTVRVDVDDTLFVGPKVSRAWLPTDVRDGYIGPVDALTVDNGRLRPGVGTRSRDPAVAAGADLAALLRRSGFAVVGPVDHTRARPGAPSIAAVGSAPMAALLRRMLQASDNDYAEVLARQVALAAGVPATFGGAVRAIGATLTDLGVEVRPVRLYDGSGLSHNDRIAPQVLADIIDLDLRTPRLAAVVDGLPVAGRPGSLQYRMGGPHGSAAGRILAKTGTLTGVHDLAGLVLSRADGPLIFVFMDGSATDDLAAEDDLDNAAVSLASCGCRP